MNRIEINDGTPGVITESKKFEQLAILNAFKMLSSGYTAIAPNYFLSGCAVTTNTVAGEDTVTITSGFACYGGEPIEVPGQFIIKLVSEVCWLEANEEAVNSVSYNTAEGQPVDVEIKRTLILKKGDNYPAEIDHLKLTAPSQVDLIASLLGSRIAQKGSILEVHGWELTWFDSTGLGLTGTRASGYAICNGNNDTPDKRGVTAVGAVNVPSNGAGGLPVGVVTNHNVGDVFGSEKVVLSVPQLPNHTHNMGTQQFGVDAMGDTNLIRSAGTGAASPTSGTGGGEAHENMQPSRAALFVMVL